MSRDPRETPADLDVLERSTIAALDVNWEQFLALDRRQTMEFATSLQQLKFAKMMPGPIAPGDTLENVMWAARLAYLNKVRDEYATFERLVRETRQKVEVQRPFAQQLHEHNRPVASQKLWRIVGDLGTQDVGRHGAMNQKLMQAQLEDNAADYQHGVIGLAQKTADAYANHKYVIK